MQKYVDLKLLGSKLQILSAFALDQMKGFICIEAEKQCDINEVMCWINFDDIVINCTHKVFCYCRQFYY